MAQLCRECKEPVKWGVSKCPFCGEENPTGANPGDVMLVTGAITALCAVVYIFAKREVREAFLGLFSSLFSN
jgi:hypothetical protein